MRIQKRHLVACACVTGFVVFTVFITHRNETKGLSEIYFGNPVSYASVAQEFFNDPDFKLEQLNGVRVINEDTGRFTYYFEYIANRQDTLRRIKALPFQKNNHPSSLSPELMESAVNPLDNSALPQEVRNATAFFWDAKGEEFTFYECYKSPVKHTLLISKTSDRILHKVEFV